MKQTVQMPNAVTVKNPEPQKNAYQQNLSQMVSPETPTTRSTMARLMQITNEDPERGYKLQQDFQYLQSDPTSMYFNPYTKATNQAVANLQSYGIDLTQDNSWLKNYYVTSGTTNTPKAPTKKSSLEENMAYQYYQWDMAQADTDKAKMESAALKDFISYWTGRTDKNLSDEEIIKKIDWSKYPTQKKMKETAAAGKPMELNEAVDMATDDWIYAQIWAARNDGGTGNVWKDMANSYLQTGNTWQENKDIADRLAFGTDTYAPYTVGSTADDVCAYYGVSTLDDAFLQSHMPDENDKTEVAMWNKAKEAVDFTKQAKTELAEANAWLDKQLAGAKTEEDAKKILSNFDRKLEKKWKSLKKMDDSTQYVGKLIGTSEAIDYSYNNVVKRVNERVGLNGSALTTDQTLAKYGLPTETDQAAEVAKAGEQNVNDARYALDDYLNPSEQTVFTNIAGMVTGKFAKRMAETNPFTVMFTNEPQLTAKYTESVSELSVQIAENQKAQAELDNLNKANAEIASRLDTIRDAFRSGAGDFGFMYDLEDGEYVQVNDSYLPNSRYAQALVDLYNAATGNNVEYGDVSNITSQAKAFYDYIVNYNPTYEEDEEIPFLLSELGDKKQQLEADVEKTSGAQAAYNKQQEAWNSKIALYDRLGMDSTGLKTAQLITSLLPYFSEYDSTEWLPYGYFDMAAQEIGDNATYDQVISKTAEDVKRAKDNIEAAQFIKEFYADNGASIPAAYAQNIDRFIAKNERILKDYEYYTLQSEMDFMKAAALGRRLEEEQKLSGNRKSVDFNYLDNPTEWGLDQADFYSIMTDKEKDTFYYLYAKEGKEAAQEYYNYLADGTYGVLQTRNRLEIEKAAAEEVNQGWLSGLWANAKAIASAPLEAAAGVAYDLVTMLSGEEFNPNNAARSFSIYSNAVNAETTQAIKEGLGKKNENGEIESTVWSDIFGGLYEIGYMRGRSLVNGLLTGGFTKGIGSDIIKEILGAFPMGLSAADTAIAGAKDRGAQDWQAYTIGGITLAAETISEGLTYGNIQEALHGTNEEVARNVVDLLKNWLTKSGVEEMTGETITEIVEQLSDKYILDALSEHEQLVQSYIEKLGLDPDNPLDRQRAEELAGKDEIGAILHTALISYISPSMDVVSGSISDKIHDLQNIRLKTRELQGMGYNVSMSDVKKEYYKWKEQALKEAANKPKEQKTSTEQQAEQQADQEQAEQVPAQETAPEQTVVEQPVAQREAKAPSDADMAFLQELDLLESVQGSDSSTIVDAVGSLFGGEENTAENDTSRAAAANMTNLFGTMSDAVTQIWALMMGAQDATARTNVKQALKIAALSRQSAAAQTVQSEAFQNAGTIEEQVDMLTTAAESDMQNETVRQDIAKNTREYRIAEKEAEIIKGQPMEKSEKAEADARKSAEAIQAAEDALDTAQSVKEAKLDSAQAADREAIQNPTDDNVKMQKDAATDLEGAVVAEQQAQDHLEKTQQANAEAEAKEADIKQQELTGVRQQAEQMVAEEDQRRAEIAAQQAQEAQAIAEQQAQAQAEEDERSGKAQEERNAAIIEGILDREGLEEGEERDNRREELANQLEKVKIRLKDLRKPVGGTDGMLAVAAFERKIGIPIVWADLGKDARGMYGQDDNGNAVIYLNKNLMNKMSVGQAIVEAALHEITHSMENTNAYNAYRSVVLRSVFGIGKASDAMTLYNENKDFRAKVDQMIVEREMSGDPKFLGDNEQKKIEAAEKEIIADFARLNLAEKDVVQRFMDSGLGGRMRNALHNINQALKNYLSGMDAEERKQAEYFRKAERAFQKAIDEVSEKTIHPEEQSFSISQVALATGMRFDPETLTLYDKDNNVIDGVNRKLTTDDVVKTPVGYLIRSGLDMFDGENSKEASMKPGYIDPTSTAGKAMEMMTGLMNMIARYKDSDLIWEIGASTLSSTFSALKSNSDTQYQTTVDFGTICAKTQAIVDVMSKVMLDKIDPETGMIKEGMKPGLTRQEIMKVYNATHNAKLSVPCPVCYVFSRWMGVPSLLGQMSQFQKDHVITEKDADGKTKYDKNGRAVINWDATQAHVDEYIGKMLEKYGSKDAVNDKKTRLQAKLKSLEEKRNALEESLLDKSISKEEKENIRNKIEGLLSDMVGVEDELGEVRAFNWVAQALCVDDGKYQVDRKNFRITPDSVIFDMNRTSEFAEDEKNWTYRTTRGAGMGKAINPYSGETIGDILYGVNKQNKGKRMNALRNPWLNYVEGGKNIAAATQLRNARKRAKQQNLLGGQRLQSTSDFRPEWGLDYVMSFLELQAAGSKVQMYTKVAEAIDFFASVGADVNMSIMGKGTGWREATAEEIAQMTPEQREAATLNGKVYMLEFSDITGMDFNKAKEYKDKYSNVQMILVGMNDTHIRLAMKNSDIDFIIPWHSSGNSKEVLSNLISAVGEKLNTSVDYTTTQSDMKKGETKSYYDEDGNKVEYSAPGEQTEQEKQLWDLRMRILTGKANNAEAKGGFTAEERNIVYNDPWLGQLYNRFYVKGVDDACYGVKLSGKQAGQIFPYEYWDTSLTKDQADENGRRFVEYCERMGVIPRFSQFKDDPGYWKLLIDRPMYNNDGTYHEQQTINVTNARVGQLDESGKLDKESTDLPMQAQAVYAPKDKRSPMYKEYQQRETNAVMAAEEALGMKYTEKQTEAMDEAQTIQTTNDVYNDVPVSSMSIYGEQTEADMDLLPSGNESISEEDVARIEKSANEAMNSDFAHEYDNWDKTSTGKIFDLGKPHSALVKFGLPDVMIRVSGEKLNTLLSNHHGMSENVIKQIPNIIKDPIIIMPSSTVPGRITAFGEVMDEDGHPVLAALSTNVQKDLAENIEFTIMNSAYGKDYLLQNFINKASQFVIVDKKRADAWAGSLRVEFPSTSTMVNSDGEIVPLEKETVNTGDLVTYNEKSYLRDSTIDQWLKDYAASNPNYAQAYIAYINPDVFLDLTTVKMDSRRQIYDETGPFDEARMQEISPDSPMFLRIDGKTGEIYGHEGRHRAVAMSRAGIKNVPVLIFDFDSKYSKTHQDSMLIRGQSFDDGFKNRNKTTLYDVTPFSTGNREEIIEKFGAPAETQEGTRNLVYSMGGEQTEADMDLIREDELNQTLVDSGALTQEEVDAYNGNLPGYPTTEGGSAQRQFGSQTAQTSDALHDEVKQYLYTHSDYTPDTNQAQIDRAVDWVKKQANADDPDGYRAAVDEVTRPDFDYRSADGQARMLTVMGMAALKGDTATEMRLADAYNQQGTDLGRQLQARKLFRMMTPVGRRMILQQEVARINQEYKNTNRDTQVKLSDWTLRAAEAAETEEDFQKVQRAAEKELAEQMPANWKDKLRTWRMLSMLANPRTHIRNIIGNAIFKPVVGLKNVIGAGLENAIVKEGGEKTKAIKYTEDAKAFAAQDVQAMKDTLTGEAKYSPESRIEQEKKAFGQGKGILSRTIGKGVQALADFNSDMLEKEDWIFLNGHYQNALASYMTANGLTSADMTGKTLEKARTYAVLEAQKATYRDANAVSSWLNAASREGGVKGFLVDAVLPFKKTPANILRRGIEYSPVGLIKSLATAKKSVDLYAAWEANGMKGKMPKGAKSLTQALDDVASGLTGTAISALGALAYALGAVKLGFGGDDDDELDKERGSQEYSIELFGHSFTVDWAAPVCMPFFTGAALYKSLVEDGNADFGAVVDSMMKITEPVFNLSMLDGVNSLLTSIKYSQSNLPIGDLAQKIGANYVGSFVPSISGAVARTVDTTRRKNYVPSGATMSVWQSMLEQAQNKIPYLSMKNIPYRDVWGEAEESGRVEAFLENFVLPGYINQMSESKLNDELQRLYDRGEEGVIPKAAGKTVGGEKLDAEQYDRYVVTRGQTAKKYLEELIERPEYIALTDNNPEAQAQLMKDVWEYANAVARYDLFPNYKMDSWIASAYASGNVVDAALNREEQKAQNAYVKQSNSDLFTAIDAQDADTIAMCVEGLKQAGKDDKSIRNTVTNHYRNLYKQAYLADDEPTMEAIRYGLEYLDLGEYSIYDDVFDKWEAAVDAERED